MARRHFLVLAPVLGLALMATSASACIRDRTPDKLVLIDKTLETKPLSSETVAEVTELRKKAAGLSMARKFRDAESTADKALRILAVRWEEPKQDGPPTRC